MRKPFYWTARKAWFVRQPTAGGRLKTIYLADDETDAMRVWREEFQPERRRFDPSSSEGVILSQESTQPAVSTTESHSTAKRSTATIERPTTAAPAVVAKPARVQAPRRQRPKHEPGSIESRLLSLARVLMIAELLAPLRRGATIRELASDVGDILGQTFHPRTIQRDVILLESLNVVTIERSDEADGGNGRPPLRVRWNAGSIRSAIIERMAEYSGERLEAING